MSSPAGRDQVSDAESEIRRLHECHHDGTCAECEELWPCSAIVLAEQNGLLRAERDILRSMIYRQSEEAREHLNRTWSGDVRRASPVDQGNQVIREQGDMSLERSEVAIRKQRSEWEERQKGTNMKYPILLCGDQIEFEQLHANMPPVERPDWPLPSFDATDWAKAFCKIATNLGYEDAEGKPIDEDWMVGWFANALMRGFDEHAGRMAEPGDDGQTLAGEDKP